MTPAITPAMPANDHNGYNGHDDQNDHDEKYDERHDDQKADDVSQTRQRRGHKPMTQVPKAPLNNSGLNDGDAISPDVLPDNLIAFQGVSGAYSELACRAVYPNMTPLPCVSFAEAMAAVKDKRARYAMLPVENSIAGRVGDIHHLLPEGNLVIIGEHYQRVVHHLLAVPGANFSDIKTVRSHPQALAQCRKYIRNHGYKAEGWNDTATAARDVGVLGDRTIAAIGSGLSGDMYGLVSLQTDIADEAGNTTRFLIMSRDPVLLDQSEFCITTLLFKLRSVPAALYKALGGFATCGVNITKIESYPVRGALDMAQFYIDVEGHPDSRPMKLALEELKFFTSDVRILGTYLAHPRRKEGE